MQWVKNPVRGMGVDEARFDLICDIKEKRENALKQIAECKNALQITKEGDECNIYLVRMGMRYSVTVEPSDIYPILEKQLTTLIALKDTLNQQMADI